VHRLGLHRHRHGAPQPRLAGRRVDLSADALALARENIAALHVGERVRALLQSDLFARLRGESYDLIVSNPPYVTRAEVDALPAEYAHEPELGLRAGDDGLDLALRILRDAPEHLTENGLLICRGRRERAALVRLLPDVPFAWVEFKVGQMGVFVIEREDLLAHHARMKRSLADLRARGAAPPRAGAA
jgi:ribosomal protein L3 glutamine methyltransferase